MSWVLLGVSGIPADSKGYLYVYERLYSILANWRGENIKGWQPRNWGKTTPLSSSTHNWNAKEEFPENWNISSVKDKRPVCGEAVTPISNFFFSFISIIRSDECVAIHHYRKSPLMRLHFIFYNLSSETIWGFFNHFKIHIIIALLLLH